ncbi:MAG: hypothetical protein ACI9GB_003279 [Halioglobus sp.]
MPWAYYLLSLRLQGPFICAGTDSKFKDQRLVYGNNFTIVVPACIFG